MKKERQLAQSSKEMKRLLDLLERTAILDLYLNTDLGYHAIARKLGMGTQRVTTILKGLKKPR